MTDSAKDDSAKDTEAHAVKWDLRHPDFNAPFAHTDAPFLSATPGGAWVAVGYDEFIESGSGDLAQVAWRQPGIVFFKYLLGSNLARLEFSVGVQQVLARLPDYAPSPLDEAMFHGNSVTRGYRALPVVFTPGRRSSPVAQGARG